MNHEYPEPPMDHHSTPCQRHGPENHRRFQTGGRRHRARRLLATPLTILVASAALAMPACSPSTTDELAGPTLPVTPDRTAGVEAPRLLGYQELTDAALACIENGFDAAEPTVRSRSYDASAETVHTEARAPLTERLARERDRIALGQLAVALGRLDTTEAEPLLTALYQEIEQSLQPWFAEALVRLGHAPARQWLLDHASDRDLHVSSKATLALAALGQPGDSRTIDALRALYDRKDELRDSHREAPYVVLAELARLGDVTARERLHDLVDREPEAGQIVVAEQLARIGDETGRGLLRAVLDDPGSVHRVRAAAALIALGDYSGFQVLSDALTLGGAAQRELSTRALGQIGYRASLPALVALQNDVDDPHVRIAACTAIVVIIGLDPRVLVRASVDYARSAFESADPAARARAATLIGDLPEEEALPLLVRAAGDAAPEVRESAAKSAARLKNRDRDTRTAAARTMSAALDRERDPEVMEEQVIALARLASPVARESLAEVASARDRVGVLAIAALIAVGDPAAARALHRAYRSREPSLRLAVMEGAILANNRIVVRTLAKGVRDRVFAVRLKAAEGLVFYDVLRQRARAVFEQALEMLSELSIVSRARAGLLALGVIIPVTAKNAAMIIPVNEMLASDDVAVRRAALPIISAMEWREASPLLRQALLDRDVELRREVVDRVDRFTEHDREGARRVYKALVNDGDELTRFQARARLALIIPAVPPTIDLRAPATPDIAPVEDAFRHFDEALETLDGEAARLDAVLQETRSQIARRATSEKSVEQTRENRQRITDGEREIGGARRALSGALNHLLQVAEPVAAVAEVTSMTDDARQRFDSAGRALTALDRRVVEVQAEVTRWLRIETTQVQFYCQVAETAIPAGRYRDARRNLRAAGRLSKRQPCVLYAEGLLHDEIAGNATSAGKQTRHLRRARKKFQDYLETGGDGRDELVGERIREIDEVLAGLQ